MDLQITITLSDKLFGLLEDKLPNLGRRVESALTKELGRTLRSESEISVKPLVKKVRRSTVRRTAKKTGAETTEKKGGVSHDTQGIFKV